MWVREVELEHDYEHGYKHKQCIPSNKTKTTLTFATCHRHTFHITAKKPRMVSIKSREYRELPSKKKSGQL